MSTSSSKQGGLLSSIQSLLPSASFTRQIRVMMQTFSLISFAQWLGNRINIYFWHQKINVNEQYVEGIPLDFQGLVYFIILNTFCFLTYITYLRAALNDAGSIPVGLKAPFISEYDKPETCTHGKQRDSWKPTRAHYCSTC